MGAEIPGVWAVPMVLGWSGQPSLVPDPDDVLIETAGKIFGPAGLVITLLAAAVALKAWLDVVTGAQRRAVQLGRRASRLRPLRVVLSWTVLILVPLAQVLMLGMCFVASNLLSMNVYDNRSTESARAVDKDPLTFFDMTGADPILRWDNVSGVYMVLAVVVLGLSYRWAENGRRYQFRAAGLLTVAVAWWAVLTVPLVAIVLAVVGVITLIGGLISLLGDGDWDPAGPLNAAWSDGDFLMISGGAVFFYFVACWAALHGSRLVLWTWGERGAPTSEGSSSDGPPAESPVAGARLRSWAVNAPDRLHHGARRLRRTVKRR